MGLTGLIGFALAFFHRLFPQRQAQFAPTPPT